MSVRTKVVLAYVAAGIGLVVAIKVLAAASAIPLYYLVAALAAAMSVLAVAIIVKCPHCNGRPFALMFLPFFYVPNTCANCDRELHD
jgi:hypothetical protein